MRESGSEVVPDERPSTEPVATAVVAVSTGDGVRRIFHSLGVQRIVTGGQSMNPSTAELLEAVEAAPADDVVILPNNKNIVPVAEQVGDQTDEAGAGGADPGRRRGVRRARWPTTRRRRATRTRREMREAADNVVAGEVTRAVRDSVVRPRADRRGRLARASAARASAPWRRSSGARPPCLLGELLTEDHEIVTLIEGEGATPAATRRITEWLAEHHAGCPCEVHHGGQPLYPYYVGIE